jgi:ketosteroid isomerase-like protein
VAAGLAALAAHGPIGGSTGSADAEGTKRAVQSLAAVLQAGDLSRLAASYAHDAEHRDLAGGARARGPAAIEAFLQDAYGGGAGGDVAIVSVRLLTADVAIAQLTLSGGGPWPPYLTALLRRTDRWHLIATRSGGNPDTRERGLPMD